MNELIPSFFVVLLAAGLLGLATNKRFSAQERKYFWFGFFAHILASIAQVLVTRYFYGGGDMFLYYSTALRLTSLMRYDVAEYLPMVVSLTLQGSPPLGMEITGVGTSTGAMSGFAALVMLPMLDSLYATCIVYGLLSLSGQIAMYATMRNVFGREYQQRLLVAAMLVPSVVFWSSAILKEPLALTGVGWLVWSFQRVAFTRHRLRGVIVGLPAFFLIAIFKPYVLFPLAMGLGVWFYWTKTANRRGKYSMLRKSIYLSASIVLTIVAVYYLGKAFPQYAVDNVTTQTAHLQSLYANQGGGSSFQYGESTEDRQIWYAPMALVSALLRPFFFEVHNATSAINAIEMLVVLYLVLSMLLRKHVRARLKYVPRSPAMMFMLVFVLIFAVAAGLGAPNLGSLSRYRIPFMPFYLMFLLIVYPGKAPRRRSSK